MTRLNSAIIKAIKITEDKDFAEKNAEILSEALKEVLAGFASFTKSLAEMAQKAITTVIVPAFAALSKAMQKSTWIKPVGNFAVNAVLAEEERKRQELFEAIKPSTALVHGIVPPYLNETQSLLNSIRMETAVSNLPKINIPKYDIPKIDIDIPKIDLGLNTSSVSEDVEISEKNEHG